MPDYKKMYFELFNAVTAAIDHLKNGQCEGEDAYVEDGDAPLGVLTGTAKDEQKSGES
jgi:hypothetical protein